MEANILFVTVCKSLLLPPGLQILLLFAAWLLWAKFRYLATALGLIGLTSLYLLSTPMVALKLTDDLQNKSQFDVMAFDAPAEKAAIVILGGGRYANAPEYDGLDTVNQQSLVRLRYGAHLYRALELPILLTGGRVHDEATAEAVLMNQVMIDDFLVSPRWLESKSTNTSENAQFSAPILQSNGIEHIILISHGWHLLRAQREFEKQGFIVHPAPIAFYSQAQLTQKDYVLLPNMQALQMSHRAMYEHLGAWWYSLNEPNQNILTPTTIKPAQEQVTQALPVSNEVEPLSETDTSETQPQPETDISETQPQPEVDTLETQPQPEADTSEAQQTKQDEKQEGALPEQVKESTNQN